MLYIDYAVERSTNEIDDGKPIGIIVVVADVNHYMWGKQTIKGAIAQAVKAWLQTGSGKCYLYNLHGYVPKQPDMSILDVRDVLRYTSSEYMFPSLSNSLDDVGIKELAFQVIDADINSISWNADENLCV